LGREYIGSYLLELLYIAEMKTRANKSEVLENAFIPAFMKLEKLII